MDRITRRILSNPNPGTAELKSVYDKFVIVNDTINNINAALQNHGIPLNSMPHIIASACNATYMSEDKLRVEAGNGQIFMPSGTMEANAYHVRRVMHEGEIRKAEHNIDQVLQKKAQVAAEYTNAAGSDRPRIMKRFNEYDAILRSQVTNLSTNLSGLVELNTLMPLNVRAYYGTVSYLIKCLIGFYNERSKLCAEYSRLLPSESMMDVQYHMLQQDAGYKGFEIIPVPQNMPRTWVNNVTVKRQKVDGSTPSGGFVATTIQPAALAGACSYAAGSAAACSVRACSYAAESAAVGSAVACSAAACTAAAAACSYAAGSAAACSAATGSAAACLAAATAMGSARLSVDTLCKPSPPSLTDIIAIPNSSAYDDCFQDTSSLWVTVPHPQKAQEEPQRYVSPPPIPPDDN